MSLEHICCECLFAYERWVLETRFLGRLRVIRYVGPIYTSNVDGDTIRTRKS
jgi:hypothetical protein